MTAPQLESALHLATVQCDRAKRALDETELARSKAKESLDHAQEDFDYLTSLAMQRGADYAAAVAAHRTASDALAQLTTSEASQ